MTNQAARRLRAVRLLHTAVWALLAGCVVAIPWLAWHNQSIFGTLYVIGCAYLVAMYLSARSG